MQFPTDNRTGKFISFLVEFSHVTETLRLTSVEMLGNLTKFSLI